MQIAENEGGREIRQSDPKWDTARFESDQNAIILAELEFIPYLDVDVKAKQSKSKEITRAKSVWSIKYPPTSRNLFVIDGNNGLLLLKR